MECWIVGPTDWWIVGFLDLWADSHQAGTIQLEIALTPALSRSTGEGELVPALDTGELNGDRPEPVEK
jgi:hypothetical protein